MILKTKSYDVGGNVTWHMWDNILHVSTEPSFVITNINQPAENVSYEESCSSEFIIMSKLREGVPNKAMMIKCTTSYKIPRDTFMVIFNTESYIMSDDGKTIEKHVMHERDMFHFLKKAEMELEEPEEKDV